jgi:prepilin-type N-terminal cleavage/methylation domain-containing protein
MNALRRNPRGFTLIELMIVVAIIGILASVAIPKLQRSSLRARKTERDLIMSGVAKGMQDYVLRKDADPVAVVTGAWNPALPVGADRRSFVFGQPGWTDIDLQVQGLLYHSYQFTFDPTSTPAQLVVAAQGDLDANGEICDRVVTYEITRGGLFMQSDIFDAANVF